MGHRGGPDTTPMPGSINHRIQKVLLFMMMHSFMSVSSFLVAMCDSPAQDTKHLTGIMLGSWGVFTELVESLFAVDNATAFCKLMYDSHMCIVARKVTFDKLQTKVHCISEDCELRHPASDLAEVHWESLDFGSIGEVFQRAAPATTELVEQVCAVCSRNCRLPCPFQRALHRLLCSWGSRWPLVVRQSCTVGKEEDDIGCSNEPAQICQFTGCQHSTGDTCLSLQAGGRVDWLYSTVGFYLFASRVPKRVIVVL